MTRKKSDRELESLQSNIEYQNKELKVFIADLLPDWFLRQEMDDRMLELENLVNTYGWIVIVKHIQKRWIPDYKTYIWSGKMDDIMDEMKESWANILIVWNILKSHQIYNLNEKLRDIWAKAWDRVDLILKIFERHAKSTEAKLQIELAAISHMWARIFGMGMELSRQWWGIWTRWKWETNTEIMKRHLREKKRNIKKDLENYKRVRAEHRKSRKRKNLATIWIVGYTNAWKSTLMNSLTKKWVLAEDKLFATLWTNVGNMYISPKLNPNKKEDEIIQYERWKEFLLNDTIGFIRDLPPDLIEAFSSTLEDSIESDLLFHVVDASDPKISSKIKIVDDILEKIEANQPRIYVFNNIDEIDEQKILELKNKFAYLKPIFVSAYKNIWLDELKRKVLDFNL